MAEVAFKLVMLHCSPAGVRSYFRRFKPLNLDKTVIFNIVIISCISGKPTTNLALVIALPIIAAIALLIFIVAVYARFCRKRRGEFDPRKDLVHLGEVRSVC